MKPKGRLLIIGGSEDVGDGDSKNEANKTYEPFEILKELMHSCRNKKLELISTGSRVPKEVNKHYQKAFQAIGYPDPGFISIQNKSEAHQQEFLDRLEDAGGVFFTGGDQFRLATILGGTPVIDVIKRRFYLDPNFLIAGTSAGAMVMSSVMISAGGSDEPMIYGTLMNASGFGFLTTCIIDTHFIKRGRFGRLSHSVVMNPDQLGIGLGEDASLIITKGSEAECRGSGLVVFIDGKYIGQTNITEVGEGDPIFVENLKVHILVKGCRFSLAKRKLYNPAIDLNHEKKSKRKKMPPPGH